MNLIKHLNLEPNKFKMKQTMNHVEHNNLEFKSN